MRLLNLLLPLLLACSSKPTIDQDPEVGCEADSDAGVEPEWTGDLPSILRYTAAIVEGTAVSGESNPDKDYTYTSMLLEDLIVHRGAVQPGEQPTSMILQQFGGTSPEGRTVRVSDTPGVTCGERQLLFLTNQNWRHSPLVPLWSLGVSGVRVVKEDGQVFLTDSVYALGGLSDERFSKIASEPLFEPSEEEVSDACGSPYRVRPLVRTDEPVPDGAIGVEALLAAVDATGLDPSGEFQSEPHNWDKPIQLKRSCGDVEPYYPGCERHPDDGYTIDETGACLTLCSDGVCAGGKSCVQTSVRPACGSEGSETCSEQLDVCIYIAEMDFASPVDGNGAMVWGTIYSEERLQDQPFVVSGGAATVKFVAHPYATGYDTPYGDFSAGQLRVIDPNVYDLHSLERGTIPPDDVRAIESAVAANPEAYASSCGYSIIFRDGEREPIAGDADAAAFAYLQDFSLGYPCARNGTPIDGKPVFEHIDCSEVTLTQGVCVEG